MTEFYLTDPHDPEAPVRLDEYHGLRPGDQVVYNNPEFQVPLSDGPVTLTALYRFPPIAKEGGRRWDLTDVDDDESYVSAVCNDGEFEVNADNLVKA